MNDTLKIESFDFPLTDLGLSTEQAEVAKNRVTGLIDFNYRTVLLSVIVNLPHKMDEATFRKAVEKGLGNDVRALVKNYKIIGNLRPISYLQLVNDKTDKYVSECNVLGYSGEEYDRLQAEPPFKYAVFYFPAIERNYQFQGKIPPSVPQEDEFLKELQANGVNAQTEGGIGSEINLED